MVYDAFTYFNEEELLLLRLNILNEHVDYFVLVESRQTFMGQEKPLYYAENKDKFSQWNDKIIHIIAPNIDIQNVPFERHWLCYELIEEELIKRAQPEDICYCSDLDEIWIPQRIDDFPHSLAQLNYCYYLNMRSSEDWVGTLGTKAKNLFIGFNKLNRSAKPNILPNGGWHFTNQGGPEQVIKKVTAYDHGHEINHEWVKEHIRNQMENGGDFLGRELDYLGRPYKFWLEEEKWPEYLKKHKEEYKSLCK